MKAIFTQLVGFILLAGVPWSAISDDTEMYDYALTAESAKRPKVLIILDNSGSMRNELTATVACQDPSLFEPTETYSVPSGYSYLSDDSYIYYDLGAEQPVTRNNMASNVNSAKRFPIAINQCHAADIGLRQSGYFIGNPARYAYAKRNQKWVGLSYSGNWIYLVDCKEDIDKSDSWNTNDWHIHYLKGPGKVDGLDKHRFGFPQDGNRAKPYSLTLNQGDGYKRPAIFTANNPAVLYSANYLRWAFGGKIVTDNSSLCPDNAVNGSYTKTQSRLKWAQDAIKDVIAASPGVDVGLMLFNYNDKVGGAKPYSGGRVRLDIGHHDYDTVFKPIIDGVRFERNTPLCETMYEAYRYLAGLGVYFGDDQYSYSSSSSDAKSLSCEADDNENCQFAATNGNYFSPFPYCVNELTVILATDGIPTRDHEADGRVEDLTGKRSPESFDKGSNKKPLTSHLPNLTKYLNGEFNPEFDLLPHDEYPGKQRVRTFTVGMGDINGSSYAVDFLKSAATGSTESNPTGYYNATDVGAGLSKALLDIFYDSLTERASFASASVSADNFDRTQHLDWVYYSMFLPTDTNNTNGRPWWGNIKKYKVSGKNIIDAKGNNVFDSNGEINKAARSYWSSGVDGNNVTAGGVLELLQKKSRSSRTIYTDINGKLTKLTGSTPGIASLLEVPENHVQDMVNWIYGQDLDDLDRDGSTTDTREQLVGDILHSKPLAISYGESDVGIAAGTNYGMLHFFNDKDAKVDESWAFIPAELLRVQSQLRYYSGTRNYYGVDGAPVALKHGNNKYLYFGLRRGGRSYYALDVTGGTPKLKWKIDSSTPGFAELGQSWSEPIITTINHNQADKTPALIFSAGYDPNKDLKTIGQPDSIGRGVYIVNALTGQLIWSVTPRNGASLTYKGFTDSMPGSVSPFDSDADGLVDRLYVTDTGGNVFRIDMPTKDPKHSKAPWTVHKLASLGSKDNIANDRRFFYEAAVVQTKVDIRTESNITVDGKTTTVKTNQTVPFDAVLIGSGNRSHPLSKTTSDQMVMLQDRNIKTRSITDSDITTDGGGVITLNQLYDVTSQPITEDTNPSELQAKLLAYGGKRGWVHSFAQAGEKSLSAPIVVNGVVYYTTYTPTDKNANAYTCTSTGNGRVYAVDLQYGYSSYAWKYIETGGDIPDTPQIIIPSCEGDSCEQALPVSLICPGCEAICEGDACKPCVGNDCEKQQPLEGDLLDTGRRMIPEKIYYYIEDET